MSNMEDASPRTDTSTDADTEEKMVVLISHNAVCVFQFIFDALCLHSSNQ